MINLDVGIAYEFTFKEKFSTLNGVYVLGQIMTFKETLDAGVNLMQSCFTPAGYLEVKYATDIEAIKNDSILKLLDPDTLEEKLYIPKMYLDKVPDHNVKKYYKIALGINVEYMKDNPRLDSAITALKEQVVAVTGLDISPDIFELSSTWLSDTKYQEYEDYRDKTKMKIINYFSENNRLKEEIVRLKSKIHAYESKIRFLHTEGLI